VSTEPLPPSTAAPGTEAAPPSPFADAATKIDAALSRAVNRVTGSAVAPYQAAVVRIGFSLTFVLYLLREWPNRQELYGTTSPWSLELAKRLIALNQAFTVLTWSQSRIWFEIVYHAAIVIGVLLLLGWRTRTMSVLFMVAVLSVQNRSVFMGDGGDNVIHLMAIYLVLTRCGQVWSLDARRRSWPAGGPDRTGVVLWATVGVALLAARVSGFAELSLFSRGLIPGVGWGLLFWGLWVLQAVWWWLGRRPASQARGVADIMANLVHNAGMLIVVAEVCMIYSTAGWYKIQGSRWEDGTAVYYPLHLDYFAPWPSLANVLGGNGVMVMLITYGTVIVQVAFPFTLFNRRVKNVLLCAMILEHASIAILLGLPFFSLAMIAADAVFLPTNFLRWAGARLAATVRRPRPPAAPGPDPAPSDPGRSVTL
jgi:hypothetical protein